MKTNLKCIVVILCISLLVVSCKDERSIQTYFVEHQELPEFLSLDISTKMVDFSKAGLSEEELIAYKSVRKLDVLAYRIEDSNLEAYSKELKQAKYVFKNEKYEELIEFKDRGINFKISTIGNDDSVDEFLVLAHSKDFGFSIVRVLGNQMKPEALYKLVDKLQDADVDSVQLDTMLDFFKK